MTKPTKTGGVLLVLGGAGAEDNRMGLSFPAHLRAVLPARQMALLRRRAGHPQILKRRRGNPRRRSLPPGRICPRESAMFPRVINYHLLLLFLGTCHTLQLNVLLRAREIQAPVERRHAQSLIDLYGGND